VSDIKVKDREPAPQPPNVAALSAKLKDPDYEERWVRDTKKRTAQKRGEGYQIVKADEVVDGHTGWENPEGGLQNGDLVLMKCRREHAESKREARRQLAADQHRQQIQRIDAGETREERMAPFETDAQKNYQRKGSNKFISVP
jgi:hypothetical protein